MKSKLFQNHRLPWKQRIKYGLPTRYSAPIHSTHMHQGNTHHKYLKSSQNNQGARLIYMPCCILQTVYQVYYKFTHQSNNHLAKCFPLEG